MLKVVGPETGTRFESEAYDVGHLYTLAYYLDSGLIEPPIFLQTIFGTMGGIGPDVDHIVHMRRTADRLLGDAYEWSMLGAGPLPVRHRHRRGDHGLARPRRAGGQPVPRQAASWPRSNADQVRKIRGILEALSLEVATPDEARSAARASRAWTTSGRVTPRTDPARGRAGRHRRRRGDRRRLGAALPAARASTSTSTTRRRRRAGRLRHWSSGLAAARADGAARRAPAPTGSRFHAEPGRGRSTASTLVQENAPETARSSGEARGASTARARSASGDRLEHVRLRA